MTIISVSLYLYRNIQYILLSGRQRRRGTEFPGSDGSRLDPGRRRCVVGDAGNAGLARSGAQVNLMCEEVEVGKGECAACALSVCLYRFPREGGSVCQGWKLVGVRVG